MKENTKIQLAKNLFKKILKSKKRTIIFILVLLVMIFGIYKFISLLSNSTKTFLVEKGKIYQDEIVDGYIIREEQVIVGDNYGNKLIQIKNEGEKVGKDEAIFRYAANNEVELNEKIQELDVKIQEALKNETTVFSSDTKLLDNQIEDTLDQVYELTDLQKITEYKKDINTYITKKTKIAGELSKSGSYIKDLIKERSNYEKELNNSSEYITATRSGIVSYKVDGLEDVLKTGDFSYLSKELLDSFDVKTSQIIASSNEKGKVIDNFKCYIACILDSEEAKQACVGDILKLRLTNSEEVPTKIAYIKEEKDGARLFVFEIEKEVNELVKYRKIVFDVIWWSDTGLKIPIQAINYEGNLTYIIRNRAGYEEKVYVKIIRQNDKYAIVENYSNEELVNLGYDLNTLSGKKSIALYDEIKVITK